MGDDTWLTVFPDSFHSNMSHPFDSFNVEDLHTVDNGVIEHLFPLLTDHTHARDWDLLIGHFLGVDHVGHRVGPDHPTMLTKQEIMNEVLAHVVEALADDTLLVLLGDHGMDRKGDHGGDSDLEVSAGMWIYSKGPKLSYGHDYVPKELRPTTVFPGATVPHRFVQQIDLVPTLSLLLGLPIPFNNLGTVIPELFWRDKKGNEYARALELNAQQIERYLSTYRSSSSGNELDSVWDGLQAAWVKASDPRSSTKMHDMVAFTRLALETCRSLWAQFSIVLMGYGLCILFSSIVVGWFLYDASGKKPQIWANVVVGLPLQLVIAGFIGSALSAATFVPLQMLGVFKGVNLAQHIIFGAGMASILPVITATCPRFRMPRLQWSLLPILLHPLAFLSNSFTFWEDRAIPFFLLSSLIPPLLVAFYAPQAHLRKRILFFGLVYAVCVRLMGASTMCREEQHPWCHITFFAGGTVAEPPALVLCTIVPICFVVPWIIRRVLAGSKSDQGVARFILPYALTPIMLAGAAYWILEWFDSAHKFDGYDFRYARSVIAQTAMSGMLFAGGLFWQLVPACITITTEQIPPADGQETGKQQVIVLGFANALGSPYLVFWCIALGIVWIATQLTGQVVLGLAAVALIAHLEIIDCVRDARALLDAFESDPATALQMLQSGQPAAGDARIKLDELSPIALLGLHAFFATGHMSTISSIQWKTAFVLTSTVSYPASPLLVALNTFGPLFLFALAAPLLALWNVAPLNMAAQPPTSAIPAARQNAVRAGLGIMAYYSVLLTGSALGAALLRRHLMVWKVFAPRYMAGAAEMLVVDLAVLVGMWVGVRRLMEKVGGLFQARTAPARA
jgi:phosphatidylinositol glycan class O